MNGLATDNSINTEYVLKPNEKKNWVWVYLRDANCPAFSLDDNYPKYYAVLLHVYPLFSQKALNNRILFHFPAKRRWGMHLQPWEHDETVKCDEVIPTKTALNYCALPEMVLTRGTQMYDSHVLTCVKMVLSHTVSHTGRCESCQSLWVTPVAVSHTGSCMQGLVPVTWTQMYSSRIDLCQDSKL